MCIDCGKPTGDDRYDICEACETANPEIFVQGSEQERTKGEEVEALAETLIAIYGSVLSRSEDEYIANGAHPGEECSRLFREAIVSALPGSDLRAWQPISSAPDQTYVLVYVAPYGVVKAVRDGRTWLSMSGAVMMPTPTHWMPLPAPPSDDQEHT